MIVKNNIKEYKILFKNFIREYVETKEDAFLLKASHTGDVVNIISLLSHHLNLDSRQQILARLTALFHDLGRFTQYRDYKTFNDNISIDHSAESVRILEEYKFLDKLPITDQKLIKTAIIQHNKKSISTELSPSELCLSMLIRDADKLSNFPIFLKIYDKLNIPSNQIYKEEFIQLILSKIPINNSELQTIEDYYLYHLCWFNDLNFKASIDYAIRKNFINKIIERITIASLREKLKLHFKNVRAHCKSKCNKINF